MNTSVSTPRVSVIIIVKNDPGVELTLSDIEAQHTRLHFETIVVDASAPETLASIRAKFPAVRWEHFDQGGKRFTIPEQRNRGLALSRGEIIVFTDANCRLRSDWLQTLIAAIDDGEDVVAGPCYASNTRNLVNYIKARPERTHVPECTTVNVALRRSVIKRVGEFDINLPYGEDVDYFWRVTDAGYQICFEPAAAITHDFGGTEEQIRRAFRYGKARAVLHRKHWRRRWQQLLLREPHVWIYPLFILSLPLALRWPTYLLVLIIPVLKNRSLGVTFHHLIFGWGVLAGLFTGLDSSTNIL